MATVALPSRDILNQLLRYDPETGLLYWRERTPDLFREGEKSADHACKVWNSKFAGKEAFTALTSNGYRVGNINYQLHYAHRVVWAMHTGEWPEHDIDHINGDGTDNRISNLRAVTHAENGRNICLPTNNKSGAIGVRWNKYAGKWVANIRVENRQVHLGYFDDFDDAVATRKAAERRFGFHPNHGRKRVG